MGREHQFSEDPLLQEDESSNNFYRPSASNQKYHHILMMKYSPGPHETKNQYEICQHTNAYGRVSTATSELLDNQIKVKMPKLTYYGCCGLSHFQKATDRYIS